MVGLRFSLTHTCTVSCTFDSDNKWVQRSYFLDSLSTPYRRYLSMCLDYQMLIYRRSCRYVEWCTCENVYEDHSDNWSQFILMDGSFQFHNKYTCTAHCWAWIERTVSVEKNQCERNIIAVREMDVGKKSEISHKKKITRRKLYLFLLHLTNENSQWNKRMQPNTII